LSRPDRLESGTARSARRARLGPGRMMRWTASALTVVSIQPAAVDSLWRGAWAADRLTDVTPSVTVFMSGGDPLGPDKGR
jgi:hypothetical protein